MNYYREESRKEQWWSLPGVVLLVALLVIVSYVIGFAATGGDLAIYRFWAPKRAAAEREVFKQSQSHVDGEISYLSRLRHEYETADSVAQKESLRNLILEESRMIDPDLLPTELRSFVDKVR